MPKLKLKIKSTINKIHPEQTDEEIFLSNDNEKSYKLIQWKSKRKGKVAYDLIPMLKGEKLIPIKGLFPCFVLKSEMDEYKESKFIGKENK